jgi:hypothetical protein
MASHSTDQSQFPLGPDLVTDSDYEYIRPIGECPAHVLPTCLPTSTLACPPARLPCLFVLPLGAFLQECHTCVACFTLLAHFIKEGQNLPPLLWFLSLPPLPAFPLTRIVPPRTHTPSTWALTHIVSQSERVPLSHVGCFASSIKAAFTCLFYVTKTAPSSMLLLPHCWTSSNPHDAGYECEINDWLSLYRGDDSTCLKGPHRH